MRIVWSVFCVALVALVMAARPVNASEGFDDVAKLAKAGVTEDVLLNFVKNSPVAFDLTVDEILYLTDLGVTPKTISAIMDHGKDLAAGKQPETPIEVLPEADKLDAITRELDEDAEYAATNAAPAVAMAEEGKTETPTELPFEGETTETGEKDGRLIFATPLSSAVLNEQESVSDTVAAPVPVTAPPEGEVTTATFYEALTPYGTWIKIDGAWCWQPAVTVSDAEWQPYCDRGHWVQTDCGWFWQSDYSWGWAPFHYGRWKRCAGYGWLWTPDTVWSPAWVSWRECDSHYGWAPLPPSCGYDVGLGFSYRGSNFGIDIGFGLGYSDYCFVSADRFCDYSLRRHRLHRRDCGPIFNRTTIVQNNITVINNRVTVRGPRFDRVQKLSGKTLPQLRLADAKFNAGQKLTRTAHEDRRSGTLQIYRPNVKAAAANDTPATIAKKQLASHVTQTKISADAKVLATAQKADDIRARQLAAQEARRKTAQTLQQSRQQNTALNRAEAEQKKLQNALGKETDGARKAELAAKLDAQKLNAENARKQKQELDAKAADSRKRTLDLAQERNQALKAKNSENVAENKAKLEARKAQNEAQQSQLEAQRKSQQEARQAQLDAQRKAQQDSAAQRLAGNKAKLENQRNEAEARKAQLEAQRNAQQEAKQAQLKAQQENTARQAQLQAKQQEAAARQAQLEAQRNARNEAAQQAQLKAQQEAARQAQQAQLEAQRNVQRQAQQQAQQQAQLQAQQEAAARQAQQQAQQQARQQAQQQAQQAQQEAAAARQAQAAAQRQAQQEAAAARQAQAQAERDARQNNQDDSRRRR